MATANSSRFITLLQREFREYKNSLLWAPIATAVVLGLLMLGSVVFVSKFSFLGDWVLERMIEEGGSGLEISLSISEDGEERSRIIEVGDVSGLDSLPLDPSADADRSTLRVEPPAAPAAPDWEVIVEDGPAEEAWNFSREWNFNPESSDDGNGGDIEVDVDGRELNFMFSIVHGILLLMLILTSTNYLLSSLYDDRKDRSILFFRSMPVSERDIVLSKLVTAMLVAPVIYLAVSLVLQLSYVVLMMALVWRMGEDPFIVVVQNIDFAALMLDPISGWVLTALLIAPAYAWLLLASALAKRSPFLMAVIPLIALLVAEGMFLGSNYVEDAVERHVPHLSDGSAVGFYLFGPDWTWTHLDLMSLVSGLAFAAVALAAAVWLRKHRWELN